MSDKMPLAATTSNDRGAGKSGGAAPLHRKTEEEEGITAASAMPKRKRSKVSFSEEVISKDGDGNKILVEEEHGVFLSMLGQKRVVSGTESSDDERSSVEVAERISTISFGDDDDLLKQKLAYSEKEDGNIIQSTKSASTTETKQGNLRVVVEYDNLVVKIGLLKIGHRYRMIVPIPKHWEQGGGRDNEQQEEKDTQRKDEVKIIEDSFDDDLRGEIETGENSNSADDSSSGTPSKAYHHYLNITLSAKRRGPYRGRIVLELTRNPADTSSGTTQKCIMSVQVDATIMGQDMGTPKLRNGVTCLGKIVGYDSDDETEWQGFDS